MVRLWDIRAGKSYNTLTNHKKGIRALVFHPKEYTFASGASDNIKVNILAKILYLLKNMSDLLVYIYKI